MIDLLVVIFISLCVTWIFFGVIKCICKSLEEDYTPPCMRNEPPPIIQHLDNSPFYIINTKDCGYKIVDKKSHVTIAEMLPNGKWINYYLGEHIPR